MKRKMSILFCAALSLSLLAGCGTEDAGSEGSGSEGSGEGSGASGEEITLSIGGWGYNDYFVPVEPKPEKVTWFFPHGLPS